MRIVFAEPAKTPAGCVAVFAIPERSLLGYGAALDKATQGALKRAMAASRFAGKKGQILSIMAPNGLAADRVVVAGLGAAKEMTRRSAEGVGGALLADANNAGQKALSILVDAPSGSPLPAAELAARVALGLRLRSYRFDKYRTKEKPEQKPTVTSVTVYVPGAATARKHYAALEPIADSVFLTRDVVSEPPNVVYPESLAKRAKDLGKLGLKVEVLGEAQMRRLGMNALLGVGQGSRRESQMVVMRWDGGRRGEKPLAFIGKGVCFDTGGISLKPAGGMGDMKWDMAGSGAVIGIMRLLAARKARVNAVGLVGLVENMPDGNAQRPGDVVRSMSGQTIEITNTDAEGRLVLCDVMWYAQEKFDPRLMVEFSTLTGAIIVALGHERAGLFSNDTRLSTQLRDSGAKVGEKLWRMPLGSGYDEGIKSDIADMVNSAGREGSSILAAQFLKRFVQGNRPWAHIDIAGTAWSNKGDATTPKGATAYGVRLIDQFVADHYER
ncbi:leucyl aminopeptidase [Reyranella sp. CPCC 100927]|uniref:leucyl aminopeptidase n=1 Tax=Reyranella sp. CPCC 100927 TaxID=2599616 RepID=UPI0011B69F3F|nr:leucyl aminopeptidase [Reyranella sp. CPCC 100927]TWT03859.1 leucyl aminopeptidase [Reyranella sp. CPCC 100927]